MRPLAARKTLRASSPAPWLIPRQIEWQALKAAAMNRSRRVQPDLSGAFRLIIYSGITSIVLAALKITTGVLGNSYALVADGIESLADVVASIAVFVGLRVSVKPADDHRPWGYGKIETMVGLFISLGLIGAAALIATQSIHEIRTPHHSPAWFTLPVLLFVVAVKLLVSQHISRAGGLHGSSVLEADSWHHLSDALTSGAAFIGISIALIGGVGWEAADDWAALVACGIIFWNGARLARGSLLELVESRAPASLEAELRGVARTVEGVCDIEKLRVRKSGMGYIMDIHVEVDGDLSVAAGHEISGAVKSALYASGCGVKDVTVHIEPHGQHSGDSTK